MERPSGSGPGGIRIQGCSLAVRELRLASALELASLAGLAGDGITGDLTGTTTMLFSITTPTSLTAEFSLIATTSIAPADFMEPTDFTAEGQEDSPAASMDLPHPMPRLVRTPAHSAALIMEESQEASPLAGSRALVEASMGVEASTEVAAVTGEAGTGNSINRSKRNG
jgi:hypothetical protein